MLHPVYQENLDWGRPRIGHPEGSLRNHIEDLEANLERIRDQLVDPEPDQLRLLIHVHDICKPDAWTGVASDHPRNHAFLARQLLAEFCSEPALLAITQFHDDGYFLYNYFRWSSEERMRQILVEVQDPELFVIFNLVDNCLAGKRKEPIQWFLRKVSQLVTLSERVWLCRDRLQPDSDS